MTARRTSVALCTFNGADFLQAQLASIAGQSVQVDEVVIGDDGSSDGTAAVLEDARRILPQLRVLPATDHLGVAGNFERTMAATAGDVIFLSDQDDIWHPDRVSAALAVFSRNPDVELLHSDARVIDGSGELLKGTLLSRLGVDDATRAALVEGAAFAPLLQRNLVTGATVAVRRRLLDDALPFPGSWLHDEWLAVLAASHRGTRLVESALIDYRLHGSNEIGAERITLAVRLSRLRADRVPRNARLLARAGDLVARLPEGPARDLARAKLQHETIRSAYPIGRLRRGPAVLREWGAGRYTRFGGGIQDVVRDLVQPARRPD